MGGGESALGWKEGALRRRAQTGRVEGRTVSMRAEACVCSSAVVPCVPLRSKEMRADCSAVRRHAARSLLGALRGVQVGSQLLQLPNILRPQACPLQSAQQGAKLLC